MVKIVNVGIVLLIMIIQIYIYILCVSKLGGIFRILFPFSESHLQATAISFFIYKQKYVSCLFNYAFFALRFLTFSDVFFASKQGFAVQKIN